jgi:hypothetical protein
VDNPYESREDREATCRLVAKLPKSAYISVFSLTFFKYTALYEKAKLDGYEVDSHLGKKPDAWQKDSQEVKALKAAALVNEQLALAILGDSEGIRKVMLQGISKAVVLLLEPLRHLKMLYLSSGRKKLKLLDSLRLHARDYAYKYFSFSRINRMAH